MKRKFILIEVETIIPNTTIHKDVKEALEGILTPFRVLQVHVNTAKPEPKR